MPHHLIPHLSLGPHLLLQRKKLDILQGITYLPAYSFLKLFSSNKWTLDHINPSGRQWRAHTSASAQINACLTSRPAFPVWLTWLIASPIFTPFLSLCAVWVGLTSGAEWAGRPPKIHAPFHSVECMLGSRCSTKTASQT